MFDRSKAANVIVTVRMNASSGNLPDYVRARASMPTPESNIQVVRGWRYRWRSARLNSGISSPAARFQLSPPNAAKLAWPHAEVDQGRRSAPGALPDPTGRSLSTPPATRPSPSATRNLRTRNSSTSSAPKRAFLITRRPTARRPIANAPIASAPNAAAPSASANRWVATRGLDWLAASRAIGDLLTLAPIAERARSFRGGQIVWPSAPARARAH